MRHADRPLKIGSFSAASNVTGILSNSCAIADLLHRHGALSFWDFAAAAPYVEIDMHPTCAEHPLAYKDAIFLSPHKLVGGPGTPGVLVVRRELLTNRVPDVVGGGTVAYVGPDEHRYLDDPVMREEGGTPAIVEAIRAGLVFQLKQAVGVDVIRAREESFWRRAVERWSREPEPADPGQPRGGPALDRVVRRPRPVRPLPPPQLRRRAAQRPVRDPGARRLLLRRPVRPPTARDRARALARVRAQDHLRLRRAEARLDARVVQLLHLRGGLRLRRRRRRSRRHRRLAAAAGLPVRRDERALAPPRRLGRASAAG